MKVTFEQAIELAPTCFVALRDRANDKSAFDSAVANMKLERFSANLVTGATHSRNGNQGQFVNYDWASDYELVPQAIFYDFFKGFLMNKYSRILRGLNP